MTKKEWMDYQQPEDPAERETVIRKGVQVEDVIQLNRDLEGLRRERLSDRHETEKILDELRRALQSIDASVAGVKADVERVQKSAGAGVSESRMRALISDCMAHPDSDACKARMAEAERAAEVVQARRAEEAEAEPAQREHESALSYLRCEECGPKFIEASAKVPEFRAELLEKYGDRDVDALIRVLSAQGYAVEKKEAKAKDWLTGV